MSSNRSGVTRRRLLGGVGTAGVGVLAGCLGDDDTDDSTVTDDIDDGGGNGNGETGGELDVDDVDVGVLLEPQDHGADYTDAFHSAALTLDGSDADEYNPEITVTGPEGAETLGEGDFWTPDKLDDYMIEAVLNGETVDTQEITREELAEQLFNYEGNRERIKQTLQILPAENKAPETWSADTVEIRSTRATDMLLVRKTASEEAIEEGPVSYYRVKNIRDNKWENAETIGFDEYVAEGRKGGMEWVHLINQLDSNEAREKYIEELERTPSYESNGVDIYDSGNFIFHHHNRQPNIFAMLMNGDLETTENLIDAIDGYESSVWDEVSVDGELNLPSEVEDKIIQTVSYGFSIHEGHYGGSGDTDLYVQHYDPENHKIVESAYSLIEHNNWKGDWKRERFPTELEVDEVTTNMTNI